jgi:NAD(P)-dependent dehydrogenase (short-subunit alcohol dehydrogenase family)/acyl carrier protein
LRPDGSYLITGGLGAIGRKLAACLAEQGARCLVLVGRTQPTDTALADIAALEAAGATVHVVQADVTSIDEMRSLFARFKPKAAADSGQYPPVRGIFHAAGILDDGVLLRQTAERFEAVMAPKVVGSWNLHCLSLDHAIDLFVLFSSAAALVGSPGQASYAAGNAFMDGLARFRHARGLPAVSIQWGPWAEVGLAAQPNRAGRMNNRGFEAIRPEQGLRALEWALAEEEPVLAVIPFDLRQWRQSYPQSAGLTLLSELEADGPANAQPAGSQLRAQLLAARSMKERHDLLERHLREEIAQVLRISINSIGPNTALDTLGFDSLLALELRNRLELSLSARLSATLIWNYPTLPAMVDYLTTVVAETETGHPHTEPWIAPSPPPSPSSPTAEQVILAKVELLSDEQALRELLTDSD